MIHSPRDRQSGRRHFSHKTLRDKKLETSSIASGRKHVTRSNGRIPYNCHAGGLEVERASVRGCYQAEHFSDPWTCNLYTRCLLRSNADVYILTGLNIS